MRKLYLKFYSLIILKRAGITKLSQILPNQNLLVTLIYFIHNIE